jgi:hypothetical protein
MYLDKYRGIVLPSPRTPDGRGGIVCAVVHPLSAPKVAGQRVRREEKEGNDTDTSVI